MTGQSLQALIFKIYNPQLYLKTCGMWASRSQQRIRAIFIFLTRPSTVNSQQSTVNKGLQVHKLSPSVLCLSIGSKCDPNVTNRNQSITFCSHSSMTLETRRNNREAFGLTRNVMTATNVEKLVEKSWHHL